MVELIILFIYYWLLTYANISYIGFGDLYCEAKPKFSNCFLDKLTVTAFLFPCFAILSDNMISPTMFILIIYNSLRLHCIIMLISRPNTQPTRDVGLILVQPFTR